MVHFLAAGIHICNEGSFGLIFCFCFGSITLKRCVGFWKPIHQPNRIFFCFVFLCCNHLFVSVTLFHMYFLSIAAFLLLSLAVPTWRSPPIHFMIFILFWYQFYDMCLTWSGVHAMKSRKRDNSCDWWCSIALACYGF